MGNCVSSFRAQFRPNVPPASERGTTIPLTPKPEDGKNGEAPEPGKPGPLAVVSADTLAEENSKTHHTWLYTLVRDKNIAVLRRGFPFRVRLSLDRDYNATSDLVCVILTLKDIKNPSYAQGTQIVLPLVSGDISYPNNGWKCEMEDSKEEKTLLLEISTSHEGLVGEWQLEVETRLKGEDTTRLYSHKTPIFIIFNPYHKEDTVYMGDDEWRNEYVNNESGMIWRGSHNRLRPCIWNYAQFQDGILECCLFLLNTQRFRFPPRARGDPVQVVRHLSAVVNSPDDDGVLVGNWTGEFRGGTPPTQWIGSQVILNQFLKTKKPVKFGQCWVFSGVCTTICRALGIPCRTVTNFASAHDTHNSLTIDYFYDKDGEPVDRLNIDSIWNFHVWNEAWMDRPDLEPGDYGGWQAFDATPQETSDGMYRCGPASVAAVKRGEIVKPFDTRFLLAEVNADKVYWRFRGSSAPLKLIQKTTEAIGQHISTKAVGKFEREDITNTYKHMERSKEEREVMIRALRQCGNIFSRYYLNDDLEDVQFDFLLLDDIVIGQPFTVRLKARNKSEEGKEYKVKVAMRVATMLYNGQIKKLVKKDNSQLKIAPGTEEEFVLHVSYEDYAKLLADQCAFNVAALAEVEDSNHEYFAQDDFRVRMPDIKIEAEGEKMVGKPLTAHCYFTNPLPVPLKKGAYLIEGIGDPIKVPIKKPVGVGQEARVSVTLTPKTEGEKTIAAKFLCPELADVDGYLALKIDPAPKPAESNEATT